MIEFIILAILPLTLMVLGLPIYLVLLSSSIVALQFLVDAPFTLVAQSMLGSLDKFALLAVPFFIFAGEIMVQGGVSRRIIEWILSIFGRARSARPLTVVGASEFFGAVSGSSPATVAAIGKLMYPSMIEGGYNKKFSLGLITSVGGIASVMPPSISLILYGASSEQSIAALFSAGILPAIILGVALIFYVLWYSRNVEIVKLDTELAAHFFRRTIAAVPALGTPVIILGGIYSGIFSPTESAGIAGVYGILVGKWVYREVSWLDIWRAVVSSAKLTAQIFLVVAASGVFSWVLATIGVPQALVSFVSSIDADVFLILLAINILLLAVGCLMDPVSAIVLFTPLLLPLAQSLGLDLIHFGIVMAVNLSIGMFTPPFGLNIFTTQAITGEKMSLIVKGVIPFMISQLCALLVITYVPEISLVGARLMD